MAYKTVQQVSSALRVVWQFDFHNVNKETKERGAPQTIAVAVRATSGTKYRMERDMRDEAVKRFTEIVALMYPKADQIVSNYGPLNMRVFT